MNSVRERRRSFILYLIIGRNRRNAARKALVRPEPKNGRL
jgi:hypothetical protein